MTMEIEMPERIEDRAPEPAPPEETPAPAPLAPTAEGAADAVAAPEAAPPQPPVKSLTIGAVCKSLEREFPEISISKIRYLEDQKLIAPRRTRGGYRLYAPGDVDRLRTILRLQRDEFLPLRHPPGAGFRPRRQRPVRAPRRPGPGPARAAPGHRGRARQGRAALPAGRRARGDWR
jgi:hypothetical protein